MISLLVVEDNALVREGLCALLATTDDISVIAAVSDGELAIDAAARAAPDVVLMDLELPGVDGVVATRAITAAGEAPRVVVLTSFSERARILDALDAGAVGYLLKDAPPEELLAGIRAAARGDSPLAPKAAKVLIEARLGRRGDGVGGLTDRQRDVLALLADGRPNKQIARELGIAEKTVKAHLTAIFQALGVTDRTQAALWAHRHRLRR